jgi:hypothetical protein
VSRSVDLFIASPKPIEEVAAEISRLTGMNLKSGPEPGSWVLDEGSVHAELRAHPYVDDGDLAFERYPFALSTQVSGRARPADSPEANLLRKVSESLRKGPFASLLVHDLQFRDGHAPLIEGPAVDSTGEDPPGPSDEIGPERQEAP